MTHWDKKRRAWMPGLSRTAQAAVILLVAASLAAVTQIDLTTQAKGILAIANGGTGTASTLVGLIRGNASAMTAAELSGDATTSGSNAVTVVKINGTTVTTNSAADQTVVTTASATGSWATLPNCTAGALQYTQATHLYNCGTVLTGSFAYAEVPSGTINGTNDTFTLANTPSPAGSLLLLKNGEYMTAGGVDYTLTTNSIVFVTAAKPKTGDGLIAASYRY